MEQKCLNRDMECAFCSGTMVASGSEFGFYQIVIFHKCNKCDAEMISYKSKTMTIKSFETKEKEDK